MDDDELLERLERAAFGYFLEQGQPASGLVADTSRPGSPASIAVVGLALSAYPIGVERGWLARDDASARVLTTLRFFESSAQGSGPDATGYRGFYYHGCRSLREVAPSGCPRLAENGMAVAVAPAPVYFAGALFIRRA